MTALANALGFNFGQLMMVDSVSAADVDAEVALAMSYAITDTLNSAIAVQEEILRATHAAILM